MVKTTSKNVLLYAHALYDAAMQKGDLDNCYQNLQDINAILPQNIEYFTIMDKSFNQTGKFEIMRNIADKLNCSKITSQWLEIIAADQNLRILPQIIECFIRMYEKKHDIAVIKVTTAIPLSTKQDKLLKQKLTSLLKKEIIVKYNISPEIIGGLIIDCLSYRIDSSVKHKLQTLEKLMKGAK